MPGRDQMHVERRPAGEGAQPGFRQMRQPVGPAMRAFVFVESLAQSRVSVPGLDRQLAIAERDALDRDPEPANVAQGGLDLGRHRTARGQPHRAAAGRNGEAIDAGAGGLRPDDRAVDNEVQIGIVGWRMEDVWLDR